MTENEMMMAVIETVTKAGLILGEIHITRNKPTGMITIRWQFVKAYNWWLFGNPAEAHGTLKPYNAGGQLVIRDDCDIDDLKDKLSRANFRPTKGELP